MAEVFRRTSTTPDSTPKHQPQVRLARSAYNSLLFKKIGRGLFITFCAVVLLYTVFAATLLRVVPTTSGAGLVPVKNITYSGGMIPAQAQILVNVKNPEGKGFLDHLRQAFVPGGDYAVVSVVAGPYGKLTWAPPGISTVDGELVDANFPPNEGIESPLLKRASYLNDEYLVTCISGACVSGKAFIVHKDHVLGSTLSRYEVPAVEEDE